MVDNTKGLIIGTVLLTGATTFIHQAQKGTLDFRSYLGASFMGIFLTGIAMANPRLARNFAILIIFGVLLKDNGRLFTYTLTATEQPLPTTAPSASGGPGPARASAGL